MRDQRSFIRIRCSRDSPVGGWASRRRIRFNPFPGEGGTVKIIWQGISHRSSTAAPAGRLLLKLILVSLVHFSAVSCVIAAGPPPGPPPPGYAWVESGGQWVAVPPPPSEGPYEWVGGRWVAIGVPPPARAEWVPGHWGPNGWVPGHWAPIPEPIPGATWVPGHWEGPVWVRGHWVGAPTVVGLWVPGGWVGGVWVAGHWSGRPGAGTWVPGHWGPRGRWNPGHWRR